MVKLMKYLLFLLLLTPLAQGAITGAVRINANEGGKHADYATGVQITAQTNLLAGNIISTNGITVGSPSVTFSGSGSGGADFTASGGNTEHLGVDLGTNANTGTFYSTSGITTLDWLAFIHDFSGGSVTLPNSASDAALSAGQIALNTTDKQLSVHNGTKEVAIPLIHTKSWSFDPDAVCDGAVDRLFLMTVASTWAPEGITITGWRVSFEADPTTEADLDLKFADAFIGVANATVMDVLDTTAGVSSETSAANINGGAAVAVGKVLYLEFGTAYTETTHQIIFEMDYEVEED